MPTRNASAVWEGGLQGGNGRFDGESGAIGGSYSFGSRFGDSGGTNPEELLAAAEAACFSMALSGNLERAGVTPNRISTSAACTVEKSGNGIKITSMALDVTVDAQGLDAAKLTQIAEDTKKTCPVSVALGGIDRITVSAKTA
ncbi:MAG TPA: OsmC family peroxiredoxin [Longimicrobiaceae bacterium]